VKKIRGLYDVGKRKEKLYLIEKRKEEGGAEM
jgi:hypothetical protein